MPRLSGGSILWTSAMRDRTASSLLACLHGAHTPERSSVNLVSPHDAQSPSPGSLS